MLRDYRRAAFACLLFSLTTPVASGGDGEDLSDERAKVFVARWAEAAARVESVDVRFERVNRSRNWNVDQRYEGRLRLKKPNLALLEEGTRRPDGTVQPVERVLWTGQAMHQFREEIKQELVFKYAITNPPLPGPAVLPFLFGMSVQDVQKNYQIKLLKETPETVTVEIKPHKPWVSSPFSGPEKALLELDARTLLPRRYALVHSRNDQLKVYIDLDIKVNKFIDSNVFVPANSPGWKTINMSGSD